MAFNFISDFFAKFDIFFQEFFVNECARTMRPVCNDANANGSEKTRGRHESVD